MSSHLLTHASKSARSAAGSAQVSARPSPTPSTSSMSGRPDLKRKQPEPSNIVYSQPMDTGTGRHLMTQVTYAVEYLKSKEKPISFRDIFDYLSIKDISEDEKLDLQHVLTRHPKVEYDKNGLGGKGSFRFRPTHNVRTADELEAFLQRQTTAQGIPVRELKDGWPDAVDAINGLADAGRVLVTRNKKDGAPRMVWPNDPSLKFGDIDPEFQTLWHKIKLPANAADLRNKLIEHGLTPTSQVKAPLAAARPKEKKKKASRRGGRTTNTHMQNILKDFSHMRRA